MCRYRDRDALEWKANFNGEDWGWGYYCSSCHIFHGPFTSSRKQDNICLPELLERIRDLEDEVKELQEKLECLQK